MRAASCRCPGTDEQHALRRTRAELRVAPGIFEVVADLAKLDQRLGCPRDVGERELSLARFLAAPGPLRERRERGAALVARERHEEREERDEDQDRQQELHGGLERCLAGLGIDGRRHVLALELREQAARVGIGVRVARPQLSAFALQFEPRVLIEQSRVFGAPFGDQVGGLGEVDLLARECGAMIERPRKKSTISTTAIPASPDSRGFAATISATPIANVRSELKNSRVRVKLIFFGG